MYLDYYGTELFSLKMSKALSVIFEIAPNYYISHPFVDYEGYSISSLGILAHCIR